MKKIMYTLAFTMGTFVTLCAQSNNAFHYKVNEVSLTGFKRIVINADIDVVLLQNPSLHKAFIEGDEKQAGEIKVSVTNDVLTVSADKSSSYKGKVQVTIPVGNLSQLQVNSSATIASLNVLQSPQLSVIVNGECSLQLTSAGQVTVSGAGGHDVSYVRTVQKNGKQVEQYNNSWD